MGRIRNGAFIRKQRTVSIIREKIKNMSDEEFEEFLKKAGLEWKFLSHYDLDKIDK